MKDYSDQFMEIAEKALRMSDQINELFNLCINLFRKETESRREMEQNRRQEIESDSEPF